MKTDKDTKMNKPLAEGDYADYAKWADWCNKNGYIIKADNDYYYCEKLPEPTLDEVLVDFESRVEALLNSYAVSAGYDSVVALCSYISSDNEIWAAQAKLMAECRDDMWLKWYEIKDAAQESGNIAEWQEIAAELPQNPFEIKE